MVNYVESRRLITWRVGSQLGQERLVKYLGIGGLLRGELGVSHVKSWWSIRW